MWGANIDIDVTTSCPVQPFLPALCQCPDRLEPGWCLGWFFTLSTNGDPGPGACSGQLFSCAQPHSSGPLSALCHLPSSSDLIPGYVWARFTITEQPVPFRGMVQEVSKTGSRRITCFSSMEINLPSFLRIPTECPVIETECPVMETECPTTPTKCPCG